MTLTSFISISRDSTGTLNRTKIHCDQFLQFLGFRFYLTLTVP